MSASSAFVTTSTTPGTGSFGSSVPASTPAVCSVTTSVITGASFTVGGGLYTALSGQPLTIGTATLTAGGVPQTISGTAGVHTISLGPSAVVVDSSTTPFSAVCPTPTALQTYSNSAPGSTPAPVSSPIPWTTTPTLNPTAPTTSLVSPGTSISGSPAIMTSSNAPSSPAIPYSPPSSPTNPPPSTGPPLSGPVTITTTEPCHECTKKPSHSPPASSSALASEASDGQVQAPVPLVSEATDGQAQAPPPGRGFGAGTGFVSTSVISTFMRNQTLGVGCPCTQEVVQTCSRVAVVMQVG
ncbi:hypothetical protein EV356DRAFT_509850 [Viridothelium virens]|uniref:Uncharacterized protein n=1 Tax=Viridothelium virens TaxID=1048519 RepID=A0A6A6HJD3_VIRVR|nr:hypothetical protein EV356DRAFT_509850 [Viridothelium virens]